MLARLFLALAFIVGVALLAHWFKTAKKGEIKKGLRWGALVAIGALLVFLGLTGRLHWLFAIIGSLLPFARRLLSLLRYVPLLNQLRGQWQVFQSGKAPSTGRQSTVESRFIKMNLDHDSGKLDGEIMAGPHAGERLSTLGLDQLLVLFRRYQTEDPDSARLLAAYLDRAHGTDWRGPETGETGPGSEQAASDQSAGGTMSEQEALAVLGLEDAADEKTITNAHRRLMQKLHPDRGGSDYLATKINQAKDVLLRKV